MLFGADDQGAPGGFDDVVSDDAESVDFEDALDLGEQAVQQPEVAAGDAADCGDGLGVGEVCEVERQARRFQCRVSTKASSSSVNDRYWWAKPIRLSSWGETASHSRGGHSDQQQPESPAVESVAEVLERGCGEAIGFVDDDQVDVGERTVSCNEAALEVLIDADVDALGQVL